MIKKTNQSAKRLEIYAEYKIRIFNSNMNLLHARPFSINVSNYYTTSDCTRMHWNTARSGLLNFLEILKWFKVSEMRERELQVVFILVHLIT